MCTVSIVPRAGGFRLVCNRDEQRTRPAARPPARRRLGGTVAIWPEDPASGGTWIGANDAGLALVLLNRTPQGRATSAPPLRSRGTIIPALLRLRRLSAVLEETRQLSPDEFDPFTLLVLEGRDVAVVSSSAGRLRIGTRALMAPLMFTSSGLGDHVVQAPRRALFRQMVERVPSPLRGQAAFHRHRWPARPEVSVCMSRADALTVSRTILEVARDRVSMVYVPLPE